MGHEHDGLLLLSKALHPCQALLPELSVPDRQHLVQQDDIGIEMRSHRKTQPGNHSAGIGFDRQVDEFTDIGKGNDVLGLGLDLSAGKPIQ